jgi:putative redox protein
MTVALYARRKGWPLEETVVRLRHSRIHAADCADCENKAGRLDRVEWTLQFQGALSSAQRTRLLQIAQMCPVHRTLKSDIYIPAPGIVANGSGTDDSFGA